MFNYLWLGGPIILAYFGYIILIHTGCQMGSKAGQKTEQPGGFGGGGAGMNLGTGHSCATKNTAELGFCDAYYIIL